MGQAFLEALIAQDDRNDQEARQQRQAVQGLDVVGTAHAHDQATSDLAERNDAVLLGELGRNHLHDLGINREVGD
ncbi:MAG: hypothetical protein VKP57_06430 [Candidatus Sericytochromatia bacterium]|nr:hypothetical protein [Candidatus Sericytochromatia bacterium]